MSTITKDSAKCLRNKLIYFLTYQVSLEISVPQSFNVEAYPANHKKHEFYTIQFRCWKTLMMRYNKKILSFGLLLACILRKSACLPHHHSKNLKKDSITYSQKGNLQHNINDMEFNNLIP